MGIIFILTIYYVYIILLQNCLPYYIEFPIIVGIMPNKDRYSEVSICISKYTEYNTILRQYNGTFFTYTFLVSRMATISPYAKWRCGPRWANRANTSGSSGS